MRFTEIERKAAESFVAGARKASPQFRQRVMTGPARRLVAKQIFAGMARSFDGDKGADLDAVIRWELGSGDEPGETWDLVIRNGRARISRDSGEQPRTTVGLDYPTLLELAIGLLNAPQAYIAGRLEMRGDVMLAQRMTTLFVVPGSRPRAGATG